MGDGPWHVDAEFLASREFKQVFQQKNKALLAVIKLLKARILIRSQDIPRGRKDLAGQPRLTVVRGRDSGSGAVTVMGEEEGVGDEELALLCRSRVGGTVGGFSSPREITREEGGAK